MNKNIVKDLEPILLSGQITQGKQVEAFEKALQEYFKYPYILTVNSATSGLTLALKMLNLAPTDNVLCTPLTCFATTASVLSNNYNIKWVDVDLDTFNISLEDCKRKIDINTRALCFVHWAGNPVSPSELLEIKTYAYDKYGTDLSIVEDCAHAFGTTYDNQFLGTFGFSTAVYSLQAIKHLTTGDGGLIFCKNKDDYDRAKLLRWYGISREQRFSGDARLETNIEEHGFKFHMNDIAATIGLCNLPLAISNLKKIRENVNYYNQAFKDIDIKPMKVDSNSLPAYWIYSFRILNKSQFIHYMAERGIIASQVHKRNDINTCVAQFKCNLPNMDILDQELVSIPCGWWLTKQDIDKIIQTIVEWFEIPRLAKGCDLNKGLKDLLKYNLYNLYDSMHTLSDEHLKDVYVIEINQQIVCSGRYVLVTKLFDNVAYIEDIVTAPAYRNRGLAIKILKTLVARAQADNVYKIVLNCKPELKQFYEKAGFRDEGVQMVLRFKG